MSGNYRRDKWDAIWIYDGEKWGMLDQFDGSPVNYFNDPTHRFSQIDIKKFDPEEDPSWDENPYPYAMMQRIEKKLDALSDDLNTVMRVLAGKT